MGISRLSDSSLADHLGDFVTLSAAEISALSRLDDRSRSLRRGTALVRENDGAPELFVLKRGLMMSYVLLDDGSRQILRFLFPGDLMGLAALAYRQSPETITALADSEVSPINRGALAETMRGHPRLAGLILAICEMERVALTDRLASLGRTSAKARVAALLLEIRNRQRIGDRTIAKTFLLGLTQEEIGDATGLTAVHVNRMLRQLEEEGAITRDNGRVTLNDERGLARTANYVDRSDRIDFSWLPEPV